MVKKISDWHAQLPKITRSAVTSSFLGSLFLVFGWMKFFFLENHTLVSFGTSAVATSISFIVILIAGATGIIGGLVQVAFLPPRRAGFVSMLAGIIPLLIYLLIMFYLQGIKHLDFD